MSAIQCSICLKFLPQDNFSSNQLKKSNKGLSKCMTCVLYGVGAYAPEITKVDNGVYKKEEASNFDIFNPDILKYIFSFLPPKNLTQITTVCILWSKNATCETLWQPIWKQWRWNYFPHQLDESMSSFNKYLRKRNDMVNWNSYQMFKGYLYKDLVAIFSYKHYFVFVRDFSINFLDPFSKTFTSISSPKDCLPDTIIHCGDYLLYHTYAGYGYISLITGQLTFYKRRYIDKLMASIRYILCLMKESKTSSVLLLNYDNETIVESDYTKSICSMFISDSTFIYIEQTHSDEFWLHYCDLRYSTEEYLFELSNSVSKIVSCYSDDSYLYIASISSLVKISLENIKNSDLKFTTSTKLMLNDEDWQMEANFGKLALYCPSTNEVNIYDTNLSSLFHGDEVVAFLLEDDFFTFLQAGLPRRRHPLTGRRLYYNDNLEVYINNENGYIGMRTDIDMFPIRRYLARNDVFLVESIVFGALINFYDKKK